MDDFEVDNSDLVEILQTADNENKDNPYKIPAIIIHPDIPSGERTLHILYENIQHKTPPIEIFIQTDNDEENVYIARIDLNTIIDKFTKELLKIFDRSNRCECHKEGMRPMPEGYDHYALCERFHALGIPTIIRRSCSYCHKTMLPSAFEFIKIKSDVEWVFHQFDILVNTYVHEISRDIDSVRVIHLGNGKLEARIHVKGKLTDEERVKLLGGFPVKFIENGKKFD